MAYLKRSVKNLYMLWITSSKGTVGIGTFENSVGEREIRASIVSGVNKESDIKFVADWGGRVDSIDLLNLVSSLREGTVFE